MMRTLKISLAVAATASVLVGASVVQPPPARASSPELQAEPAPIAATGDLLCNLSTGDVTDIIDHYDLSPNVQRLATALETPFNCDGYGGLCSVLGSTAAHAFACGTWMDFKAHVSVGDIVDNTLDRFDYWTEECEPDTDFCEEQCANHEPVPADVVFCAGIDTANGCRTIVACDYHISHPEALAYFDLIIDPLDPLP